MDKLSCKRAACMLAERGFHVFPLQYQKKEPVRGKPSFDRATSDLKRVRDLWLGKLYNVGVATGT
jgi:hypothetical protein